MAAYGGLANNLLLIDSAPARSLLFFVVDSVCLYVCLSVTLLQIDSSSVSSLQSVLVESVYHLHCLISVG